MMRRVAALAVVLCAVTSEPTAFAQSEEATAAQFFRAGLAAYDRREYRAAALAFEEAYAHVPRGAAIYNAGRAWEAAGEQARAADAFAAALARGDLDPPDAQLDKEHLGKLELGLGVIVVDAPATATVSLDGVDRGHPPRTLHAAAGQHQLVITRRDGSAVSREVDVTTAASVSVSVADVPLPASSLPPTQAPPPVPAPVAAPSPATWAWVTLGAAAAFGVGGAATYVKFTSDRSAFDATGDMSSSLHSSALTFRTATYVLWGVAGACAVASAVLFIVSGRSSSTAMHVGPGWVTGSF